MIPRKLMDRRSDEDRRQLYDLEYFQLGNTERRKYQERRHNPEPRQDWMRITKWISIPRTILAAP